MDSHNPDAGSRFVARTHPTPAIRQGADCLCHKDYEMLDQLISIPVGMHHTFSFGEENSRPSRALSESSVYFE